MRPMPLSILPIACLWAASAWAGESAPPVDGHAHHAAHADALLEGALHATDAPLRAGMLRIRERLSAPRPADAASAKQLADAIRGEVQQLIAQCQLQPAADFALHGVLALLLEGSAGLRADADDDQAWSNLQEALALYAQRFDDAGFGAPR